MNLRKTVVLSITVPLLITLVFYLYTMYSNNNSKEVISDFCSDIKTSDTIESVSIRAKKLGLKYSYNSNSVEITKNNCICKRKIKNNLIASEEMYAIQCTY